MKYMDSKPYLADPDKFTRPSVIPSTAKYYVYVTNWIDNEISISDEPVKSLV